MFWAVVGYLTMFETDPFVHRDVVRLSLFIATIFFAFAIVFDLYKW